MSSGITAAFQHEMILRMGRSGNSQGRSIERRMDRGTGLVALTSFRKMSWAQKGTSTKNYPKSIDESIHAKATEIRHFAGLKGCEST